MIVEVCFRGLLFRFRPVLSSRSFGTSQQLSLFGFSVQVHFLCFFDVSLRDGMKGEGALAGDGRATWGAYRAGRRGLLAVRRRVNLTRSPRWAVCIVSCQARFGLRRLFSIFMVFLPG